MKVSDIMQRSVVTVSADTPLKEVERLIFSLGIAGVPVTKGKKLIGIITQTDILHKLYPSYQEFMEDYVHAKDFEAMEEMAGKILNLKAEEIMNKNVTTVTADTPVMRVQSLMLVKGFGRVPVVDKNNHLIGIVSQGDIFRYLVRNEIPKLEKERYAGFIARHYDMMVNWEKRYAYEFPTLLSAFKKANAKRILDVGTWTGEYTIALSKKGVKVLGLDHNPIMIRISEEKRGRLPVHARENVKFILTDFTNLARKISDTFDAAICMGNSLPYIPVSPERVLKEVYSVLKRDALLIVQLFNYDKLLTSQDRLLNFTIQKSHLAYYKEYLFIEFLDKRGRKFFQHVVIFDSDGKNWIFKGITTVPVHYIRKEEIEKMLNKIGFRNVSFSGAKAPHKSEYGEFSFTEPFNPLESDWLNVVARR